MVDDATLLRRYAEEKSEAAFAELVRRYLNLVYSAALRRLGGDAHRAADVSQQVFVALAHHASSLTRHAMLTGWIYTTTRHAALDVIRTERRRRAREQEAHIVEELVAVSAPEADWERLRPVLDEVMDELGDRDREAVLLRFFDGRPFAEIGAALQVSEDAARMRVDRALAKLHELLARRGVTSTAAALGVVLSAQAVSAAPAGLTMAVSQAAFIPAAAAGGSGVGLIGFMSTTKLGFGVAGMLALLLTLGVATYERRARVEAEQTLVTAQHDYAGQIATQRSLEQRAQSVEQDVARLRKNLDEMRTAPNGSKPQATKAPWDPLAEGRAFLLRHPEVKQALIEERAASMRFMWGPLYQALGLTPEQIAQFEALVSAGAVTSIGSGSNGQPLALQTGSGIPLTEVSGRLRDLLGEEGFRQYQEFKSTIPARELTVQVAGDLSFTESPLTPQQADQLNRILFDARPGQPSSPGAGFDREAVIAKAKDVLSATQLEALNGVLARGQLQRALTRTVNASIK